MPNTRITDLPSEATPATSDVVPIDGATTRKTTIVALVDAARPFASQAEAETGSGTTQTMNPLTTKQAIDIARTVEKTFTATQTIQITGTGTAFSLVSTASGAAGGPFIQLNRANSGTAAANDRLGAIRFLGEDSAGSPAYYGTVRAQILDATPSSVDGSVQIVPTVASVDTQAAAFHTGLLMGTATGGDMGAGTVNAVGYYLNGVAIGTLFAQLALSNTFTAAQSVAPVALTDGATITPNLTLSNHFTLTLGGNRALANPSSKTVGSSFILVITQDGTGSRTLSFGSQYLFAGGTDPTLTTTAGGIDVISGYVHSSTQILCSIAKAFA